MLTTAVRMHNKIKVLMVCLGNICRSPLAEGILALKVDPDKVQVDSAGTAGYHIGESPDDRSILVARKHGIDISGQRCRKFAAQDFREFDIIYAMDRANLKDILNLASTDQQRNKVKLLLDEVSTTTREVPDPYYGGQNGFEKVFQLIDEACEVIADKLKKDEIPL